MSQSNNGILRSRQVATLRGTIYVPGDKSISHRSLILGGLAIGKTRISGLLEGADVMATKDALIALGVEIEKIENGDWHVNGVGLNGMVSPATPLDLGNSGTEQDFIDSLTGPQGETGPLITGAESQTLYNNGSEWVATSNLSNDGTNVGIGTSSVDASAILQIEST